MSFTRWIIFATFTGGVITLSLQPTGIVSATESATILVADQSLSSSQDTQRDSHRGKKGTSSAESSGKMQSDKDPYSGGGNIDPSSNKGPKLSHEKSGTSGGSEGKDSDIGGGKETTILPGGGINTNTGPGAK